MIPDDDIESMWMEIRPVRLPPAEPEVPSTPEVPSLPPLLFTTIHGLLSAAAHHSCQFACVFTSVNQRVAFQCDCGVTFEITLPNARKTPDGPLREYFYTAGARETTATRLSLEPHQILIELENQTHEPPRV